MSSLNIAIYASHYNYFSHELVVSPCPATCTTSTTLHRLVASHPQDNAAKITLRLMQRSGSAPSSCLEGLAISGNFPFLLDGRYSLHMRSPYDEHEVNYLMERF